MEWLRISIRTYKTIGVETVLSTDKYRKLVLMAKSHGFEIRLLYVTLRTVGLNIARVKARVKKGGHKVPIKKIKSRRIRSFEQLPWFLDHADSALIYDNSFTKPKMVGEKKNGVYFLDPSASVEIRTAINKLRT